MNAHRKLIIGFINITEEDLCSFIWTTVWNCFFFFKEKSNNLSTKYFKSYKP